MALKATINTNTQDFLKIGAGDLLFGLQKAPTYKLLPIYGANKILSTSAITSIEAVKIEADSSNILGIKEISRTSLSTSLISYDSTSLQYLVNSGLTLATNLDECIYYLNFTNSFEEWNTEPFLVKSMDLMLKMDMNILTFDSTLITFDQSNYNI